MAVQAAALVSMLGGALTTSQCLQAASLLLLRAGGTHEALRLQHLATATPADGNGQRPKPALIAQRRARGGPKISAARAAPKQGGATDAVKHLAGMSILAAVLAYFALALAHEVGAATALREDAHGHSGGPKRKSRADTHRLLAR